VAVADLYEAFQDKQGLLLIDKKGASPQEIHPTNAGYTVIAKAFAGVMK
jgi:hypothetical protein